MRLKRALAGLLSAALVLGAPGLPCWQASAQVVRSKVAGVPYKTGFAPLNRAPNAFAPASFKSFRLAPNVSLTKSLFLPPSAVTGSALQVLETPTANQVSPTVFQTLQTLGVELTKEGGSPSLTLDASFDGSVKKEEAPVDIRASADIHRRGRLSKRSVLAASATLLAVPGFSQTAQTASEHASLGPVAIGLAVLGLGLFLYNRVQARKGWKQRRGLDREPADFKAAMAAREALLRRFPWLPRAAVAIARTGAQPYELVVMFPDQALLKALPLPETFQGLRVRTEAVGGAGGGNGRLERRLALLRSALGARDRLMARLDRLGAPYDWVGPVWKGDRYELGIYFEKPEGFNRAEGLPETFEGYAVRKEILAGSMAALLPRLRPRLNGWLGPLLTTALALGAPLAARAASQASASADSGSDFLAAALIGWLGYLLLNKSGLWCWYFAMMVWLGVLPWFVAAPLLLLMPDREKK